MGVNLSTNEFFLPDNFKDSSDSSRKKKKKVESEI